MFFLSVFPGSCTITYAARYILGRETTENEPYFCEFHKRTMSKISLALFLKSHVDRNKIMQIRSLPLMNDHATAILSISEGIDIWSLRATS